MVYPCSKENIPTFFHSAAVLLGSISLWVLVSTCNGPIRIGALEAAVAFSIVMLIWSINPGRLILIGTIAAEKENNKLLLLITINNPEFINTFAVLNKLILKCGCVYSCVSTHRRKMTA